MAANNAASTAAENAVTQYIGNQSGITVTNQVQLTNGTTTCVADCFISGPANATVQLPTGFVDKNGNPITSISLNSSGQAIIEIKTGNGPLTSNQTVVYPAAQAGTATATGTAAVNSGINITGSPTPVFVIRQP
ncbi:hypothetical protein [Burkholderia sp. WAC0059]|uniref:hypothetical protein n=1 Tax=Burkholderia sp. WAC0059 TaxID=2066022 RepID=UPI0011AF7E1E|nr:hypothetical protein [Burkholderia sp. WAC0059]